LSESISPNATIAHYTIVSMLGEGDMGEVYLAQGTPVPRREAMKLLSSVSVADAN